MGHAALTMAEYFRDDEHRDVLLLIDNIFRFIQAGSEVSGLMGQMPSRLGYQPTMGTELSGLEERIANTDAAPSRRSRRSTCRPTISPIRPRSTRSRISRRRSCSRGSARARACFLRSTRCNPNSKMAHAGIVGERHYAPGTGDPADPGAVRGAEGHHRHARPRAAFAGDRNVVARARRLERFLTQPFFTTEQFTGLKGKLVSLEDALDGCERILHDEFKDYPESALYMIGAINGSEDKNQTSGQAPGRAWNMRRTPHESQDSAAVRDLHRENPRVARRRGDARGLLRTLATPTRLRRGARTGILIYETDGEGESYVAVDEGVLVKTGADVLVSVRRAISGTDLRQLRDSVEPEFPARRRARAKHALGHGGIGDEVCASLHDLVGMSQEPDENPARTRRYSPRRSARRPRAS